jgi:hypothetical protein
VETDNAPDMYVVTWRFSDGRAARAALASESHVAALIAALGASVRCEVRPPIGAPSGAIRH